jgi:hypothetical protein
MANFCCAVKARLGRLPVVVIFESPWAIIIAH